MLTVSFTGSSVWLISHIWLVLWVANETILVRYVAHIHMSWRIGPLIVFTFNEYTNLRVALWAEPRASFRSYNIFFKKQV